MPSLFVVPHVAATFSRLLFFFFWTLRFAMKGVLLQQLSSNKGAPLGRNGRGGSFKLSPTTDPVLEPPPPKPPPLELPPFCWQVYLATFESLCSHLVCFCLRSTTWRLLCFCHNFGVLWNVNRSRSKAVCLVGLFPLPLSCPSFWGCMLGMAWVFQRNREAGGGEMKLKKKGSVPDGSFGL